MSELQKCGSISNIRMHGTGDELKVENVNHYTTDGDVAVATLNA